MDIGARLAEAQQVQETLRAAVVLEDDFGTVSTVAGADVGFINGGAIARGAITVLSFPDLEVVDQAIAKRPVDFPYIPGFLSFRELPVLQSALTKLRVPPDIVLCDGQGIAHPRRFGIACHFGVVTDLPTIGVAKSKLIGAFREPAEYKGASTVLRHHGERIGSVLRTRNGKKPLFVSPGHRISIASAERLVLACCPRYRLPETTRTAHRLASG